jgi:hypothetical protein
MRVILKVTAGPGAGRKTLLDAGQALQVGRTEWADFAHPHDGRMSALHFVIETDSTSCFVRDLGSTNGTLLNGQPLSDRREVQSGDQIQAGDTVFSVQIEGQGLGETRSAEVYALSDVAPTAAVSAAPLPQREASFSVESCTSGLTLCRGLIEEIGPAEVAVLLSRLYTAYLIVDFRNMPGPPPEEFMGRDYLFDWLDPEVAEAVSPVVISQDDLLRWPELVSAGWGGDAVICLFSREEKAAMLAHLRDVVRVKPKRPDQGGSILGYCWPSVMSMLLAHNTPGLVKHLLAGIDAVLVELADLPETWQLFGSGQLVEVMRRFGFVERELSHAAGGAD